MNNTQTVLDLPIRVRPIVGNEPWIEWNITQNLTDRWGDINPRNASLAAAIGLTDPVRLSSLQNQMWGEDTFVVRKDGRLGILFEIEFTSIESDARSAEEAREFKPYDEVVNVLLEGLKTVASGFPGVEFCVPESDQVIYGRPAVWAFVSDGSLNDELRNALGTRLLAL